MGILGFLHRINAVRCGGLVLSAIDETFFRFIWYSVSAVLMWLCETDRKLAVPCPALNCDPNNLLCPLVGHVADIKFMRFICPKRSSSPSFAMICTPTILDPLGSSKTMVDPGETSGLGECGRSEVTACAPDNSFEEVRLSGEIVPSGCFNDKSYKERERRRKIGEANKGKVPWNVGRKHSEGISLLQESQTFI